jgi:cell division cycle 20-like protein 1 (cofactor of APC complex)
VQSSTPLELAPRYRRSGGQKGAYSDRYIPSRTGSNLQLFALASPGTSNTNPKPSSSSPSPVRLAPQPHAPHSPYAVLLRTELLGRPNGSPQHADDDESTSFARAADLLALSSDDSLDRNDVDLDLGARTLRFRARDRSSSVSLYSSPLSKQVKGNPPAPVSRNIAQVPYKVLEAPNLKDDFYLNLIDWSSRNVLAVGLASSVYIWSAATSKAVKLCTIEDELSDASVTSVAWTPGGTHLSVGTRAGAIQIWDVAHNKLVRTMTGHSARVGAQSWNRNRCLASGSRDRSVLLRDPRSPSPFVDRLTAHQLEVCGLKWCFDDNQLASGGNDNRLVVWSAQSRNPVLSLDAHTAAVKAIAWSPHQHGVLASGGGTADRCIRVWNTLTGAALQSVDTGSQVCNLMWSRNVNELVSTHGYSLNQILVWRYPAMTPIATLTGHTYRVLYLAMSPDGQSIVTGAGDETLRFWNVFPSSAQTSKISSAPLFSTTAIR